MGYRYTHNEILDGALATAFQGGLSRLTYGRVAKHLGIADRTIVYYFPTKEDLVTNVLLALGTKVQTTLAPAFAMPASDHRELAATAWPLLANPDADRVFGLFFEANGLATAGIAPFDKLIPELVDGWIAWAAEFVRGTPETRRTEAAAAIAVIDGLLLLRLLVGADAAEDAARALGVSD